MRAFDDFCSFLHVAISIFMHLNVYVREVTNPALWCTLHIKFHTYDARNVLYNGHFLDNTKPSSYAWHFTCIYTRFVLNAIDGKIFAPVARIFHFVHVLCIHTFPSGKWIGSEELSSFFPVKMILFSSSAIFCAFFMMKLFSNLEMARGLFYSSFNCFLFVWIEYSPLSLIEHCVCWENLSSAYYFILHSIYDQKSKYFEWGNMLFELKGNHLVSFKWSH